MNLLRTAPSKMEKLLRRLRLDRKYVFPKTGYVEDLTHPVPNAQGVYIIYNLHGVVFHVGRTVRGRGGLRQRLNNHLRGRSSFVKDFLDGKSRSLRGKYQFQYIKVKNDRQRALLEALATGKLCPQHLGLGLLRKKQ